MHKNKFFLTALALYVNYFVQGIQAIILSQNINSFADKWGTTTNTVMGVIAITGIGKVIVLLFSGMLSDRFGRKPIALIGMVGYILFFGGLMICTNVTFAYVLAFTAGAATSFLDGATYPALMEIYPDQSSVASVIVKGFIAAAGLSPMFIAFLSTNGYWFGWSLVVPFVLVALNFVFMLTRKFPDEVAKEVTESPVEEETEFKEKPSYAIEGALLMAFAFFIFATFYLWQQTSTLYAMDVVGMSEVSARGIMSLYSIGSILAVLFTSFIMAKGFKDVTVMVAYTFLSSVILGIVYIYPTQLTLTIGSFAVGFFAAGGVLQIGNAMLSQFFPKGKGKNTSIYNVFMASGAYIVPAVTKALMEIDFTKVLLLNVGVSTVCFILSAALAVRYRKVFGEKLLSGWKKVTQ
ncbi:MFS transporter [Enterococcus phoeniculicola]|jgi:MFS family permease|uniref:Major facilitator superfamily (MFS) profile domain-containing protein n=1 Tax=Enterococcus phoeniculicola ATCC BAA-412 TaxID=1158610 RepID=R3W364_9ENTE|nr:MFS transporter [Enterococcus phoeniculicola]EOL41891.1 hypothetical protein UC3_02239 [Enterococcus phoeniculicola ATCC BAA-412]EOT79830.1 hypothetical protein I589_01342 [Enterococcus phoeniculicola ATCC BAA-412]